MRGGHLLWEEVAQGGVQPSSPDEVAEGYVLRQEAQGVPSQYHRERWHRALRKPCCVEQWQWGVLSLCVAGGGSGVFIACSLGQVTPP